MMDKGHFGVEIWAMHLLRVSPKRKMRKEGRLRNPMQFQDELKTFSILGLSRWISEISEVKSERSHCYARLRLTRKKAVFKRKKAQFSTPTHVTVS